MLNVSKAFNEAFKSNVREVYIKVWMKDKLYTKSDINSLEYEGGSIVGDNFAIGSTFSNSVKLVFPSILEGIEELDEIKIDIGIKTVQESQIPVLEYPARVGSAKVGKAQIAAYHEQAYEFVPLGTFYINQIDPDRNENKTTIKAMDGFVFMGGAYESKLTYPAEIREVALEIANLSGMKINESDFYRLSKKYVEKIEGYTYRQAIGLIAQFEAGYANFDRDGLLTVKRLYDPNYTIEPTEYYAKGLKKNELLYRLGGISCKVEGRESSTDVMAIGSDNGSQINLENKVMTPSLLADIYARLENLNFYPCALNWRGNPAVEVGDWVTMTDLQGKRFKMPILTYKMTFAGGLQSTITANVKTTSQTVTERKGSLNQRIEWMKAQIVKASENSIYRGIDEPLYPKKNDIWFKPNGPDMELWTYEEVGDNVFGWILQTSTAPNKELNEAIKEATKKGQEAQEAADKAKELAENAIAGGIRITDKTIFDFAVIKEAYLVDASVTSAKIGNLAVNTANIANAAITNAKIGEISANKITSGRIDAAVIDVINFNADSITSGTINAISIKGGTIEGTKIIGTDIIGSVITSSSKYFQMIADAGSFRWLNNSNKSDAFEIRVDPSNTTYGQAHMKLFNVGDLTISNGFNDRKLAEISRVSELVKFDVNSFSVENKFSGTLKDKIVFSLTNELTRIYMAKNDVNHSFDFGYYGLSYIYNKADSMLNVKLDNGGLSLNYKTDLNTEYVFSVGTRWGLSYTNKGKSLFSLYEESATIGSASTYITGNLQVKGAKNAIHLTRDGVRATPAYEMAESFLGDIGRGVTDNDCRRWIPVDALFSDTVNLDIPYEVFLQSYEESTVWVSDFKSDAFLVCSNKPFTRFAWELKAKRLGYENERLVLQEIGNKKIEEIWR